MAKINIPFDNANYLVDESSLSSATTQLQSHLSTVMNGSGATIKLGGNSYNVDSTKLSTAMNNFVSYLGTISGSGAKVVVNGVEYSVDSTKLATAIADLHTVLGGLNSGSEGGEGSDTVIISWDSSTLRNATQFSIAEMGVTAYKVSDYTPTKENFLSIDGEINVKQGSNLGTYDLTLDESYIAFDGEEGVLVYGRRELPYNILFSVLTAFEAGTFNVNVFGVDLTLAVPEAGLYFLWDDLEVFSGDDVTITITYNNSSEGGSEGENSDYIPGLYQTGAIAKYESEGAAAIEGMMIKSWDELVDEGVIHVENGEVYTNDDISTSTNSSSSILAGDLILPDDGSITVFGSYAFKDCMELTGITIPNSINKMKTSALYQCPALSSAAFANPTGWYMARSDTATSGIQIPEEELADMSTAAAYIYSHSALHWMRNN